MIHDKKRWETPTPRIGLFIAFWLILNLSQSYFTELFNDEALYWAFGQRLDLGYFDHPPLTAWLIAITSWIPGEIGVRLPFILMSSGTIYLLWLLLKPKDEWLFISLIWGMAILHIGGFFAAPDIPLVFFLTLFLYLYQSYFYKDSIKLAIGMGIVLGLMGWTKYHAILFVFALVLSNIELLKRKSFYFMIGVAVVCILPHFWWQYTNEWITFDFHLHNRRGEKVWRWAYIGEFIGGQLLVFGPLLALLVFPSVFLYKQRDHYDCVMKYIFVVVMAFFFLNTFRGRVEANWTAMVMPAVVFLGYLYIESRSSWRTWALWMGGISFFLLLALRLTLAFEIIPPSFNPRNETHGFKEWSQKIAKKADGRPVVFINNYRKPAKYAFYTGEPTYDWNMAEYSGNQYDLWVEDEMALQGKEVLIVSNELYSFDSLTFDHNIQSERIREDENYASYNFIEIFANVPEEGSVNEFWDDFELSIHNPTEIDTKFESNVQLRAIFYQYEKAKRTGILFAKLPFSTLRTGETKSLRGSFRLPEIVGEYKLKFALYYDELPGLNSKSYIIDVK